MILPLFVYKPNSESTKSVTRGLLTFFNKFNLQDAYFFYKQQPCLVSKFGTSFFDDPQNWNYFNATYYIVFYCISFNSPLASYQFFYKTQNYPNQELIHLPLNFNTNSLVYAENAATVRTANNSFTKIFSIGDTIISSVFDGVNPEPYSDASPVQVRDPSSGQIFVKNSPNGQPYFLPNQRNTYQLVNTSTTSKLFQQMIIYPLGFVESITLKMETSVYFTQTKWAANNMRYYIMNNFKFFLIELPRQYELLLNEVVFNIEILPRTTAVDCIFVTKKPIIGNEIVYGKTFSQPLGSGFYMKRTPQIGRIDFRNLPTISTEKELDLQIIKSQFLENEVAVVIWTGDMQILAGNFSNIAPTYQNVSLDNVFSVKFIDILKAIQTKVVPSNFSKFNNLSEMIWQAVSNDPYPTSFDLTTSLPRAFAKLWDDHIKLGNARKLPKLYVVTFGAPVGTVMEGTQNSFWNLNNGINTLWRRFFQMMAIFCRMLKNQNLVPRLLLWHHDTNFSNALLYSQINWTSPNYTIQNEKTYQIFREYLGAETIPQSILKATKNTVTNAANLSIINDAIDEFALNNTNVSVTPLAEFSGFNPTAVGQNIIYPNDQYYLPNFIAFLADKYFNRQTTGDFIYERKNPFPDETVIVQPPPPPPAVFKVGEEVELMLWLGDFLWSGTLEKENAGTPYLGSSNVLSWRFDEPALTTNVELGDPVPFTSERNLFNLARYLNTTQVQFLGQGFDHNASPIAEFARRWNERMSQGVGSGRRLVMIQFCATELAHCVVGGSGEPNGLINAGWYKNEKYLQGLRNIVAKILRYFASKRVRAGLRHCFYSDHYSWVNSLINQNFPYRTLASTLVDACGTWHTQLYSAVEKMFSNFIYTKINWTSYVHDIDAGIIRSLDGARMLFDDYDFLTKAYLISFLPFTTLFNVYTAGQFPRNKQASLELNYWNLFEKSTGYTWRQSLCQYWTNQYLDEILKPKYPIQWLSTPIATRSTFQENAPIILSGEFAPGVSGNYVRDTNKMCYIGRINFTNTIPIQLGSSTTIPQDVWAPSDMPVVFSFQANNATTTTSTGEQYADDIILKNVDTFARASTDFTNLISLTNSTNAYQRGPSAVAPPRRWSIAFEYARLWDQAKTANIQLPNLTFVHWQIGQTVEPLFRSTGQLFINEQNEPVGSQILNIRNYIQSFVDYFLSEKRTIRIVGVFIELNTCQNVQQLRQEEEYGLFLNRFDKMLSNIFKITDYPIFIPQQYIASSVYISALANRNAFSSRMKQLENEFAKSRPNIYVQPLDSLPNATLVEPYYNIYVNTGSINFFRSMLSLITTRNLSTIFFNYNVKSERLGTNKNYFYIDNGARGSISSRRVNYLKYDMDSFNDSQNYPDFLYTWDLYGNSAIYSTSQLKTKNVIIFDNFYLEWSTNLTNSNYNFLVPINSINVNQISTCKNRSKYRNGAISSQITNKNNLELREYSPIWYSSNYMIVSKLNFTSLTFPTFQELKNTENLNVQPTLDQQATVEISNDFMKSLLLNVDEKFENEYLAADDPFQVVFKMFLPAFSYTHYYQLKHVNFIQLELAIFAVESNFTMLNTNLRVRAILNAPNNAIYGISATIFPEFAYATLYLYNSNYEDKQIVLYSNAFKQFRMTQIPSFIIKENGETYCRYLPFQNPDSFSVYLQTQMTQNDLSNYLQNCKLFLFLTN